MAEASVLVTAPISGKRPPGTNWDALDPVSYPVVSASLTWSWGSEPGQGNIVYASDTPITIGSAIRFQVGQYHFAGICESEVPLLSSGGNNRELTVVDYRKWLAWDKCYCLFNQIEDRMVSGVRRRRFWHVLPHNFSTMRRTWTSTPYTVAQMCEFVFKGPGIETPWTVAYVNTSGDVVENSYHPNMLSYFYNVDSLSGKPVGTWLSEMCEQCGLLYTLMSSPERPFNLVFGQKGVDGPAVTAPVNADNIRTGEALSGNPTRVRVLGDRNLYQVHDINLVADWNTNWTDYGFWDLNVFIEFIFSNFGNWNAATDPEQIIARQFSLSHALEITLEQFDAACAAKGLTIAGFWLDSRMYAGKCRNSMPAALYIQNVLLRCFRLPSNFWFTNTYGDAVYADSLQVQDKLLTYITHDPTNGLTIWNTNDAPDGNAYVVVKGYQVGKDAFESIKPDRFNVTEWTASQDIWQKVDVRLEDSNDLLGPVVVFEEPVIRSADLVTTVDGYAVFNAVPTITVPPVRATLTFAAEKFSWFQTAVWDNPSVPPSDPVMGSQTHDEVLNVGGLSGEFIITAGARAYEIFYDDDKTCRTKAIEFANNFLKFQWVHDKGSFTVPLDENYAYKLHGKLDRVSLDYGPTGQIISVSLTNEWDRMNFVPERELDRIRQFQTLLPGQQELRRSSEAALKIAASAATSRDAYKILSEAFHGVFTERVASHPVVVEAPSTNPLPMGSVYLGIPGITRPALAKDSADTSHYFAGVTVRQNEAPNATTGGVIRLQSTGTVLARVLGPVAVGDTLVTAPANTNSCLVKDGSANDTATNSAQVGIAQKAIATAVVAVIPVRIGITGASQPTEVKAYTIASVAGDYVTATGGETIAKPPELRFSETSYSEQGKDITYSSYDLTSQTRVADDGTTQIIEVVIRPYRAGNVIWAAASSDTGVADVTRIDLNVAGRHWAEKKAS